MDSTGLETQQRNGHERGTASGGSDTKSSSYLCVCGKSFSTLKGRNIHRGKMKCVWMADTPVTLVVVTSGRELGPIQNHSAQDTSRLLSTPHDLTPPSQRNEKLTWPKTCDKRWEEFDDKVSIILKSKMSKCPTFQEKMKMHCEVVYEEGVKMFGVIEARSVDSVPVCLSRREVRIKKIVEEKRDLRKKIRLAQCSLTREGYSVLLDELNSHHKKLRKAEKRRSKQRKIRAERSSFKRDPFKAIKKIIEPAPVGKLQCNLDDLNEHLKNTYGDTLRHIELGNLDGLHQSAVEPEIPCFTANITRKEHDDVVRKASSGSSPGNNAIPYKMYKKCPQISAALWSLNRSAYSTGAFPDCCRYSEGVYIPKKDGNFTPETGRPISLMNVQGKIYLAVIAKRITSYAVNNGYVDTTIQKGGIPKVRGCIEHFGSLWEVVKDAKLKRKNLTSVWLDLANAYGNVPHLLILRALKFYHVPDKIVKVILDYFRGVFGRFTGEGIVSDWQQFEIGIFTGCVISGILFVLAINLLKEFFVCRVPRAIEYVKDDVPIPPLKMFMDDCNITCSLPADMQCILDIIQEFMLWSRFKLKSSKSRVLCYNLGVVNESEMLMIGGCPIPNVAEHPIKFLGRWIRAEAKDKEVIEQTFCDLSKYLTLLDKSKLSGIQKCWGYQFMILPKMKWPLAIYDFPITKVVKMEQLVNKFLRKWLGVGHTLSKLCMLSKNSPVAIPLDGLVDVWKVEKVRLQQSLDYARDEVVRRIKPEVRSGRIWSARDELKNAEADVRFEAVRGAVYTGKFQGLGYGDYVQPWEKLSKDDKNKAVMARVKKNICCENEVMLGSLEMQSRWGVWQDHVLSMDLSWQKMFQYGENLIGFCLAAVYGNIVTPGRAMLWSEGENGMCKLCENEKGTIQHILSGCKVALGQGRYTWRHDKVLRKVGENVKYHIDKRVNGRKVTREDKICPIEFVRSGDDSAKGSVKKQYRLDLGFLKGARDWVLTVDLDKQLKFPMEIAKTAVRPDLVIHSTTLKRVVWLELTCPCEERIQDAHEYKLDKYTRLAAECEGNGWRCQNLAIEVGARGLVSQGFRSAMSKIGIRGRAFNRVKNDAAKESLFASSWLYKLSSRKIWEKR